MSADLAVKGLAVLTAIPVVMLALWADYFGRSLDERLQHEDEDEDFDRLTEMYKIRLAGITAILFQFGIFLGTEEVRDRAPLVANLMFAAAVLVQAAIQGRLEKKLREAEKAPSPAGEFEVAVNAFLWATVAGVLYLGTLLVPVAIASLATQKLHLTGTGAAAWIAVAAILGMAAGLTLNFAMGAFYLRKTLPCRPVADERDQAWIEACFADAGLIPPSLWVVETGRVREGLAMMAGFQGGRGPFKPALFISKGMLETLGRGELRAVILHEVAHLKLRHLRNRLVYSAGLIVATTCLAIFCVLLAGALMPGGDLRLWCGYVAAGAAFLATFRALRRQSGFHEIEADFHAVTALGAGFEDLASALRKLDALNPRDPRESGNPLSLLNGMGHPATERRIAILAARIESRAARQAGPGASDKAA